jgi:hypothetical protein
MHDIMHNVSLTKQFERRQAAWKPNMNIVETDPYLVDGVLDGSYVPPNATNEITMECFDMAAWQEVVHANESDCP